MCFKLTGAQGRSSFIAAETPADGKGQLNEDTPQNLKNVTEQGLVMVIKDRPKDDHLKELCLKTSQVIFPFPLHNPSYIRNLEYALLDSVI